MFLFFSFFFFFPPKPIKCNWVEGCLITFHHISIKKKKDLEGFEKKKKTGSKPFPQQNFVKHHWDFQKPIQPY